MHFHEDYSNWKSEDIQKNFEGLKKSCKEALTLYKTIDCWDSSKSGYLYPPGRKLFLPKSQWKEWKKYASTFYIVGEKRLFRDPLTREIRIQFWDGNKFIFKDD